MKHSPWPSPAADPEASSAKTAYRSPLSHAPHCNTRAPSSIASIPRRTPSTAPCPGHRNDDPMHPMPCPRTPPPYGYWHGRPNQPLWVTGQMRGGPSSAPPPSRRIFSGDSLFPLSWMEGSRHGGLGRVLSPPSRFRGGGGGWGLSWSP